MTSLRAFASWAGWEDVLKDCNLPEGAAGQPHPLPEGVDGVRKLISVADNEKQRALVALCGLVGCRVTESRRVEAVNFDLADDVTLMIHGKGNKYRIVPVSSEAWEVLVLPVTRAFCSGGRVIDFGDRFARRVITDLGVRAGLRRHISSHDLRATFATAVYDKTLDLRLVQELLGHANSKTTEIYTAVRMEKMKAAVEL